jgi:serine/threonine-protein kinase
MKAVSTVVLAVAFAVVPCVANAASWGAIAFSQSTQALGWTHDYKNERAAENSAMSRCGQYADDCEIAVSFHNACGAIAVGRNGGWGADWGNDDWEAKQNAIGICSEHDSGCRVIRWQCSGAQ